MIFSFNEERHSLRSFHTEFAPFGWHKREKNKMQVGDAGRLTFVWPNCLTFDRYHAFGKIKTLQQ